MNKPRFVALVVTASVICALLFAALYVALLSKSFYTEEIVEKINAALVKSGVALSARTVTGNPIVGFVFTDAKIDSNEKLFFEVPKLEVSLALSTLLSSNPRLSRISIFDANFDYNEMVANLPKAKAKGPKTEVPLSRIIVHESRVATGYGTIDIDKLTVGISGFDYTVRLNGDFHDDKLRMRAKFTDDAEKTLHEADITWGKRKFEVAGTIASLDLNVDFSGMDLADIRTFIPAAAKVTLSGDLAGKAHCGLQDGTITADGSVKSNKGRIWQLPYGNMTTLISYKDKAVKLSSLQGKLLGSPTSADITLSFADTFKLIISADAEKIRLPAVKKEFAGLDVADGTIDKLTLHLSGPPAKLSGNIIAQAHELKITEYVCKNLNAAATLQDNKKLHALFTGKLFNSSLSGQGQFLFTPAVSLDVSLALRSLDLAEMKKQYPQIEQFKVEGGGNLGLRIDGPPSALRISGEFDSPQLRLDKKESFSHIAASFGLAENKVTVPGASLEWRGGKITASGYVADLSDDVKRTYAFEGTIKDISLAGLGDYADALKKRAVGGTLAGDWRFSGDFSQKALDFTLGIPRLTIGKKAAITSIKCVGTYLSDDVNIKDFRAAVGKGTIAASGAVRIPTKEVPLAANIKGSFANLDAGVLADMAEASADVEGVLSGRFSVSSAGEKLSARVDLEKTKITAAGFEFPDLRGGIGYADGAVNLDKLQSRFGMGSIALDGKVTLPDSSAKKPEKPKLDMRVALTSMDLGRMLRMYSPTIHGLQGMVNADLAVASVKDDYTLKGNVTLRGTRAYGLFFPRIDTSVNGNTRRINLPEIKALAGRGSIVASASVEKRSDDWHLSVKADGKNVDLRAVTYNYLSEETRRAITGTLGFDFSGGGTLKSFRGRGRIELPSVSFMGIELSKIQTPLFISDGFVLLEDARATMYGGNVNAQFARDLHSSKWGGRVTVKSADLAKFLKDALPTLEGSISGSTDFGMRFSGDSRRTSMQFADGELTISNGEISEFEALNQLSKVIGEQAIRFNSIIATFNVDGRTLNILPGSRASAHRGDPVFKYFMADGSVNLEKSMDVNISAIGNVNIKALNTFAGALQGVFATADITDSSQLLQNFLGGAIQGFSRSEFRDVSLVIKGTPGNMRMLNVQVNQPAQLNTIPDALTKDDDNRREKDEERWRIKLEFPVGPGGSSNEDDAGGQVKGQIIEQALKGILKFW